MSQAKSKTKRLWQIFFDDEQNYDDEAVASDVKRVASSVTRKVKKGVSKALPGASGRHGVIYEGLLEDETDSEDDLGEGRSGRGRDGMGTRFMKSLGNSEDVPDLELGNGMTRETVLFERRGDGQIQNGEANFQGKPFNSREWETMKLNDNTSREAMRQPVPQNGARFIIRSESDLELAIPSGKRNKQCCFCCRAEWIQRHSHNYALIMLAATFMVAVYVAIVIGIVYGLK